MMALCGCLAKTTIFLIVVSLELDLNVLFLGYLLEGLFGSVYGLQLGIVAATSDVTGTMKERAMSFAFLEATLAIAGALAQVRMTGELRAHLCEKKRKKNQARMPKLRHQPFTMNSPSSINQIILHVKISYPGTGVKEESGR